MYDFIRHCAYCAEVLIKSCDRCDLLNCYALGQPVRQASALVRQGGTCLSAREKKDYWTHSEMSENVQACSQTRSWFPDLYWPRQLFFNQWFN